MNAISIMYHDVVADGDFRSSGFASDDADLYKIEMSSFDRHLGAIARASATAPTLVTAGLADALFVTFDDGGHGAISQAAAALEKRGWRGHFFVATDFIDTVAFLTSDDIRELRRRGHVVGSHSASHPLRMAACSTQQIRDEWARSTARLAEILREKITVASIPGGMYSREVAEAAANAGIRTLFTSEPVTRIWNVSSCTVLGRYAMQRNTTADVAAAIARGDRGPRLSQYLLWNAKKIAKKAAGESYLRVRKRLLTK